LVLCRNVASDDYERTVVGGGVDLHRIELKDANCKKS